MEIERKWLISGFPTGLELAEEADSWQGYLSIEPEVRIRKKNKQGEIICYLCIKSDGTLARTEVELPISQEQFEELLAMIPYELIHKHQRKMKLPGNLLMECNQVDQGRETSFYYAEVEFSSVEEAEKFVFPVEIFDKKISGNVQEVTEDKTCKMKNYWKRTRLCD